MNWKQIFKMISHNILTIFFNLLWSFAFFFYFIHNLFIHPIHQKCGNGTQLLKVAEKNLGRPMTLKIAMDNLKACGFYEKHGWHKVSVHEDTLEAYTLYKKD
jgi:GNAT superfamily N-acetyltransferase